MGGVLGLSLTILTMNLILSKDEMKTQLRLISPMAIHCRKENSIYLRPETGKWRGSSAG